MFVVIFEVQPKKARWDDYLGLAKQLKPKLEATDGFIDNERFKSKRDDGRLLSLSDRVPAQLGLDRVKGGLVDHELFESIYNAGKLVLLASWRDAEAARSFEPRTPASTAIRHRRVRVIRDYGMFERREAPQYYPEVKAETSRQGSRRAATG
jgi:heme-degrading monooxygenase HmoA